MGGTVGTADTEAGGNKNMINVPIKIEIKDNNLHSNSSNSMKTDSFLSQNIKDEKEKEVRRTWETFFIMFHRIFFLQQVCAGAGTSRRVPITIHTSDKSQDNFSYTSFQGWIFSSVDGEMVNGHNDTT